MDDKATITFRVDKSNKRALDAMAKSLDRDRSYLLNQAVNTFLEIHRWQIDHINEGVRQAKAGKFATEREVEAAFKKWRS